MAWDDKRHSYRAPPAENRLLVAQRYFRWTLGLVALPLLVSTVAALLALIVAAVTLAG